jgi:hypothetical protein
MKSIVELKSLYSKIIPKVQNQYDVWSQDEDGYDHEVGYGGICHLIADEVVSVLQDFDIQCTTLSLDSEVHVLVIAQFQEGVYSIDVPYSIYEKGGGYQWTKIPNIIFDESCITYNKIYSDPERFIEYLQD